MATKSILKNIVVKDTQSIKKLVTVLENAQHKVVKPKEYTKAVTYASSEEIKKIFGEE